MDIMWPYKAVRKGGLDVLALAGAGDRAREAGGREEGNQRGAGGVYSDV